MILVCAWCQREISRQAGDAFSTIKALELHLVSHGICTACDAKLRTDEARDRIARRAVELARARPAATIAMCFRLAVVEDEIVHGAAPPTDLIDGLTNAPRSSPLLPAAETTAVSPDQPSTVPGPKV